MANPDDNTTQTKLPEDLDRLGIKETTKDLEVQGEEIKGTQDKVKEQKNAVEVRTDILDEQEVRANNHPLRRRFIKFTRRRFRKDNPLQGYVSPKQRMFLDSFVPFNRYLVPGRKKDATAEEVDAFYDIQPIDPAKIPVTLLEKLHGIKIKGSSKSVNGLKNRFKEEKAVRRTFKVITPMTTEFSNEEEPNNENERIPSVYVYPEKGPNKGKLVITRKPTKKTRVNMVVKSIHHAIRAIEHIIDKYQAMYDDDTPFTEMGELGKLDDVKERTGLMIQFFQSQAKNDPEMQSIGSAELARLEEFFFGDINELKVEAREKFGAAKTFIDKLGRPNTGKSSAQSASGKRLVSLRKEDILDIIDALKVRKERLKEGVDGLDDQFKRLFEQAEKFVGDPFIENFSEIAANPDNVENITELLLRRFQKPDKDDSASFIIEIKRIAESKDIPAPYSNWAEAILSNLRVAYRLNQRQRDEAQHELGERDFHQGLDEDSKLHEHAYHRKSLAINDVFSEYVLRGQVALRFQRTQSTYMSILRDIVEKKERIDNPAYFEQRLKDTLIDFDPHSRNKHFAHRPHLDFTVDFYDDIREHIKGLIEVIEEWREYNKILNDELKELRRKPVKDRSVNDKRSIERLMRDRKKLKWEYLNHMYESIKNLDFDKIIQSLTVLDVKEELGSCDMRIKHMQTPTYEQERLAYMQDLMERGVN